MSRRKQVRTWGPVAVLACLTSVFYDEPSSEPLPGFSALDAERPTRPPRMSAPPGAAPGAAAPGARARLAATERPMEEAYVTLDHVLLPRLFFHELSDIFDGHWSQDSVLPKSLEHSGAKHLNLWTEEGLKQLTFGMDMKIPWHHVETVESWSGAGRVRGAGEASSRFAVSSSEMMINCTVRSLRSTNHSRLLEMSFEMEGPVLQRLRPKLLLQMEPHRDGLEVWVGGLLEWKVHCHFLIRRPMEHGFLLGLGRLSRAILEELRTEADQKVRRKNVNTVVAVEGHPFLFRALGPRFGPVFGGMLHATSR